MDKPKLPEQYLELLDPPESRRLFAVSMVNGKAWIIKAPKDTSTIDVELLINNDQLRIIPQQDWSDGLIAGFLEGRFEVQLYQDIVNMVEVERAAIFKTEDIKNERVAYTLQGSNRQAVSVPRRAPLLLEPLGEDAAKVLKNLDQDIEESETSFEQQNIETNRRRYEASKKAYLESEDKDDTWDANPFGR